MPTSPSRRAPLTTARALATCLLALLIVAGCGAFGSGSSPSPNPSPPPNAAFLLRATLVQALPPPSSFALLPNVVITVDGRVLTGGAVEAIFPGPLVYPVNQRPISAKGWSTIVEAAREAGLLAGNGDFTGGSLAPGAAVARLQLVADGKLYDLKGDPQKTFNCIAAPCIPPAGSPEAFGLFWNKLTGLDAWIPNELGREVGHAPAGYAVLITKPQTDPNFPQPAKAWPLAAGFKAFGKPLADGSGGRCGVVTGADAATLQPLFQSANQLTPWTDPADGSAHGLAVRVVLPGDEDPCAGLV